jgi:hypothetical protein
VFAVAIPMHEQHSIHAQDQSIVLVALVAGSFQKDNGYFENDPHHSPPFPPVTPSKW